MRSFSSSQFKFRAWNQNQADRFVSHIPDLLVEQVNVERWSDSSTDVVVTLWVHANMLQLRTVLSGLTGLEVIDRTLKPANDFDMLLIRTR